MIQIKCGERHGANQSCSSASEEKIAVALGASSQTIAHARRHCHNEKGLGEVIRTRKPGPERPPKIHGTAEAHLIAMALGHFSKATPVVMEG